MDVKRHTFDEIFQSNDENVYEAITSGEYLCHGRTLYDREEMETMLDESGFSLKEMKDIYDYYYEDLAEPDMRGKALHFITDYTKCGSAESAMEDFRRSDKDGRVSKQLCKLLAFRRWAVWLIALQVLAIFVTMLIIGPVALLYVMIPIVSSWLIAALIVTRQKKLRKELDDLIWDIAGGVIALEKDDVIYDRMWTTYSIQNTWLMYDTMLKRIGELTKKEKAV